MADNVTREVIHEKRGGSGILSWLALLLAIAALALAWMAYDRTGADLGNRIQTEVNQAIDEGQQTIDENTQTDDETQNDGSGSQSNDTPTEDNPDNTN